MSETPDTVVFSRRGATDDAAQRGIAVADQRRRGSDVALPHVCGGVRPARGDHLSRHAPAVRADPGLPPLPAAARALRAWRGARPAPAGARLRLRAAHLSQLRIFHQPHHLHRRPDRRGQVLRGGRGGDRARSNAAGDRAGVAAHRDRVPRLCGVLHSRRAPGPDGAIVSFHRGHLRLDARRVGELRHAVRAVRRIHGT